MSNGSLERRLLVGVCHRRADEWKEMQVVEISADKSTYVSVSCYLAGQGLGDAGPRHCDRTT